MDMVKLDGTIHGVMSRRGFVQAEILVRTGQTVIHFVKLQPLETEPLLAIALETTHHQLDFQ